MTEQYSISGRINILRQALASDKNKVAFLLGAGCPLSIKDAKDIPLIPDIAGLTKFVCDIIDQEQIDKIRTGIKPIGSRSITIEDILSRTRLLIDAIGESEFDGLRQNDLVDMEKLICEKITAVVNKELPDKITSYHNFSAWISGIPREHSVEIFTTNYDLLIESSLESKNIPYFDGFIGSKNAFFDLHSIEYEKLPARWIKLWKLHGSINWWVDEKGKVFRGNSEQAG
ncbi:MAG: SIR2 family protein, partial [Candidatus Moranbacteria bacterium]|nr:SIR2 family protein [Candidatus Moranbacteria bacterium]